MSDNSLVSPLDKEKIHKAFDEYLAKAGLRQTRPRRVIIDAIFKSNHHVDVETITAEVRKLDNSIGIATVYRTLQLMKEAGILIEREFSKNRSIFELTEAMLNQHHDHFICMECGEVLEFYEEELEDLQEKIAKKLGFDLKQHRVTLYGVHSDKEACCECKNKKPE